MNATVPILLAIGTGLPCLPPLVALAPAQTSVPRLSPASEEPTLGDLAQRYLTGETEGAGATVTSWDKSRLDAEAKRFLSLQGEPGEQRDASLRAAAMVVTESAGLDLATGDLAGAGWKIECAAGLVDELTEPRSALFARRFYLLAGLAFHAVADLQPAYAVLSRALRRFHDDPELQVAKGAVVETVAGLRGYDDSSRRGTHASPLAARTMARTVGTAGGSPLNATPLARQPSQVAFDDCYSIEGVLDGSRCLPPQSMQQAADHYSVALALQPALAEAHLRLGRVRLLLGAPRDAVAELDKVIAESPLGSQRHLAYLLRGAALEDQGDLERAVTSYEAATREAPEAQSVFVALGRACNHLGEGARAQEAFARALQASRVLDPWWLYLRGQPQRLEDLARELRGLVR